MLAKIRYRILVTLYWLASGEHGAYNPPPEAPLWKYPTWKLLRYILGGRYPDGYM